MAEKLTDKGLVVGLIPEEKEEKPEEPVVKEPKEKKSAAKAKAAQ